MHKVIDGASKSAAQNISITKSPLQHASPVLATKVGVDKTAAIFAIAVREGGTLTGGIAGLVAGPLLTCQPRAAPFPMLSQTLYRSNR